MHTAALAAQTYRRTEIQSRSPLELVIMLYDGANRWMTQARNAIERGDGPAKHEAIDRSLAIIVELQNVLNLQEGGEIAASLDSLYSFVNERLIDANMHNDVDAVDEAIKVLAPLHDAWTQLAQASTEESR